MIHTNGAKVEKNGKRGGGKGAQSAMEYLVTYGWAILVIAIVIMALYALGVFRGPAVANVCLFPADFGCVSSFMYADGGLTVNIEQATSTLINITAIGCNTNKTTADMISFHPQLSLQIEGNVSISGNATTALRCYSGGNVYTAPIGTVFHGYLVLNYTDLQSGLVHTVVGGLTQRIEESNTQYTGSSSTTTGSTTSTSVTTTSSTSSSTSSTSSTSIAYVPVTLTNNQPAEPYVPITLTPGSTISGTFQQMISFNPSAYSANEASDLGNIRFYSTLTNGNPTGMLDSWLESCNASPCSTSSNAVFWVNLPGGESSGGTTIYMAFGPISGPGSEFTSNSCASNCAGEAPQLSSPYGAYDDGASVFPLFYDDFSGNSINTNKWQYSGVTATQNNGVSLSSIGSTSGFTTKATYGVGNTIDMYAKVIYSSSTATGRSSTTSAGTDTGTLAGSSSGTQGVWTTSVQNGSYVAYYAFNYESLLSQSLTADEPTFPMYASAEWYDCYWAEFSDAPNSNTKGADGIFCVSGTISSISSLNWFRVRSTPPSGVMPAVTFGTLVTPAATPATFQQMINVSTDYSSSGEGANLQNVEFTTNAPASASGNVPLYSWCESGCTSSSTSKWWVKLTSSINANSNTIIYMNFMPGNVMSSSSSYTGEAPQLSPTYAQYDNGVDVFSFYNDFSGSSTPSGWQKSGTVTINNGATLPGSDAENLVTTSATYGLDSNKILDWYGSLGAFQDANGAQVGGYLSTGTTNCAGQTVGASNGASTSSYALAECNGGYSSALYSVNPASNSANVWTVYWPSASTASSWWNYGNEITYDGGGNIPSSNLGIGFWNNAGTVAVFAQWIRQRAYPPNGAMPSYNLGAVQ